MANEAPLRELYPLIEPNETGYLNVGDGHEIFWEVSGNPNGPAALYLHGGPGGGCSERSRQFFDPEFYKIVTFDQRGCNRSRPNASDNWEAAIHCQDTWHLTDDCEKLRTHLKIDVWHTVLGGSWGSTLALCYAQKYTSAIKNLALRGVFLFGPQEIDYLFQNGETFNHHPEAWELFRDHIKNSCTPSEWDTEQNNLLGAYFRRLTSSEPGVANAAAKAFVGYELSISKTFNDPIKVKNTLENPAVLIPFALFEAHYMLNQGFLRRGQLIDDASKMKDANMPVRIVHGRSDFVCRPEAAWRLYKALDPEGKRGTDAVRCEFIAGAGHSDSEPGIVDALVKVTDEYRKF